MPAPISRNLANVTALEETMRKSTYNDATYNAAKASLTSMGIDFEVRPLSLADRNIVEKKETDLQLVKRFKQYLQAEEEREALPYDSIGAAASGSTPPISGRTDAPRLDLAALEQSLVEPPVPNSAFTLGMILDALKHYISKLSISQPEQNVLSRYIGYQRSPLSFAKFFYNIGEFFKSLFNVADYQRTPKILSQYSKEFVENYCPLQIQQVDRPAATRIIGSFLAKCFLMIPLSTRSEFDNIMAPFITSLANYITIPTDEEGVYTKEQFAHDVLNTIAHKIFQNLLSWD